MKKTILVILLIGLCLGVIFTINNTVENIDCEYLFVGYPAVTSEDQIANILELKSDLVDWIKENGFREISEGPKRIPLLNNEVNYDTRFFIKESRDLGPIYFSLQSRLKDPLFVKISVNLSHTSFVWNTDKNTENYHSFIEKLKNQFGHQLLHFTSFSEGFLIDEVPMDCTSESPSTCALHQVTMKKRIVPVVYGMPHSSEFEEQEIAATKFPNACPYILAGCIPSPTILARVYICNDCHVERNAWLKLKGYEKQNTP